jgi:predicted dehydrogenase
MMGEVHTRASRLAGATVQGIAASTESRAMQAAERLGIARFYSTGEEAIDDPSVSVIHVCTPNASHFPLAMAALDAGKHVICEKPLATSARDAQALAAAE